MEVSTSFRAILFPEDENYGCAVSIFTREEFGTQGGKLSEREVKQMFWSKSPTASRPIVV